MTPYQIHVLLDLHTLEGMEHSAYSQAPIYQETIEQFFSAGLVGSTGSPWLTDRGRAYVHFLETMPLPVANWSIPGPWCPSVPGPVPAGKGME